MTNVIQKYTNHYIDKTLQNNKCRVTFRKADGTTRVLLGTLDFTHIPPKAQEELDKKAAEPFVSSIDDWNSFEPVKAGYVRPWYLRSVYDLEKKGWRSFRYDAVTNFEIAND